MNQNNKNKGFTIVEMVIIVAIMTVLLGIIIPSLGSIRGFRVQKTADSIAGALSNLQTESMSRLAAEMKLERRENGYYISYGLYRGKKDGKPRFEWTQAEQLASSRIDIRYQLDQGDFQELTLNESLIFTIERSTGEFRKLQTKALDPNTDFDNFLSQDDDIAKQRVIRYHDGEHYCTSIKVRSKIKTKLISIHTETGSCTVTTGSYD